MVVKQMDQRKWWQEFISNSFIRALCYFLKWYLVNFSWIFFLKLTCSSTNTENLTEAPEKSFVLQCLETPFPQ